MNSKLLVATALATLVGRLGLAQGSPVDQVIINLPAPAATVPINMNDPDIFTDNPPWPPFLWAMIRTYSNDKHSEKQCTAAGRPWQVPTSGCFSLPDDHARVVWNTCPNKSGQVKFYKGNNCDGDAFVPNLRECTDTHEYHSVNLVDCQEK
ncbi:hypothetical protein QBC47DRAFT_366697 [Echria macrotheca]|uniref:Uncharacterized protein n=1 Tax=Echria macrotheca TaxID=438768 RepID=A0AAJ0FGL1_9PEZI|nr:hypothetical protein QBC47DRAFT_366697 [Echria macrotheca]